MKRRHFLAGSIAAGIGLGLALKPGAEGAAYAPYFAQLNQQLKQAGIFKPSMLIDLDKLDQNIGVLKSMLSPKHAYRIVAKSLPSIELLAYIMDKANTQRLMLFHQPFISAVAKNFSNADVLVGKPMPVTAVAYFYNNLDTGEFDASKQLQWLVDTPQRLQQYQQLAQKRSLRLRINIELDVGLHRGGVTSLADLGSMLDIILADEQHLIFSGFMGYDPHVVKLPEVVKTVADAYAESQQTYQLYVDYVAEKYPQVDIAKLCLNGAGSPTVALHKEKSVINDISAGSCLVQPSDFEIPTLADFQGAAYIATPVLKHLSNSNIPALEYADEVLSWWDPNMAETYFIYGGKWLADYVAPQGLRNNPLMGYSTNQQFVNGASSTGLKVDDFVFLRPKQSEAVFLQFGDLVPLRGGKPQGTWPILPAN